MQMSLTPPLRSPRNWGKAAPIEAENRSSIPVPSAMGLGCQFHNFRLRSIEETMAAVNALEKYPEGIIIPSSSENTQAFRKALLLQL